MDAVADRAIEGLGTPEAEWLAGGLDAVPLTTVDALVQPGHRAVVVAPHPDDEVLAIGGVLAALAAAGRPVLIVAVTDGTGSHEGSTLWPPERLRLERPLESHAAWLRLGLDTVEALRLGFPDGGLGACTDALATRLRGLLRPTDTVFTTWRLDGHPDHEATGEASALAVASARARLVEVPVWAWHWARPGDARWPWPRARRIALDAGIVERKRAAVQAFESQLHGDPSTGAGPILRSTTVERAARPFEMVFA